MLKSAVLATAILFVSYLYSILKYIRHKQYAHIPQLPNHIIWGHLKILADFMSRGIPDRHPDKIFEEMWESMGKPPMMLVDLRPVNQAMVLLPTYDMAEQISRPTKLYPLSTPKSPTWHHMVPIIGWTSILGQEGIDWKELRKRYNPGFAAQHLWSLLPLILRKMEPFWVQLDEFTTSEETFSLERLISNLTFDIIGTAVLEIDLDAQHMDDSEQGDLIRTFRIMLRTYYDDKNNLPWWLSPYNTLVRQRAAKRIERLIHDMVRQKHAESKEPAVAHGSRSILALSFRDMGEELTPRLLSETSDQILTFLFAGHDTVTSMLQWAIYELSRTPHALKGLREELDEVLGSDVEPRAVCARLAEAGEELMPRLRYLNAVIRETLRLHPPAGTVRMTPPGAGFTLHTSTGESYLMDGLIMYSCHAVIQRDRNVYGDTADVWAPERWLDNKSEDIPPAAWRPYERGPRNCVGLELANLKARTILAVVARKYDFVKVGLGESELDDQGLPSVNEHGQYKIRSELYNVSDQSQPL